MLFVKVFWASLPCLLIMLFLALGIYGIPVLQTSTQKIISFQQDD